jgi:hypothetical protein
LLEAAAVQRVAAHERAPVQKRIALAEAFAHLPVAETREIVPAAVQAEPELYERIGEEETIEVDIVPPQLFKRRIVRPKYRHRLDRNRAPLVAPAPARPVASRLRFGSCGRIVAGRAVCLHAYWDARTCGSVARRLEQGRFTWPANNDGTKRSLAPETLAMLIVEIGLRNGGLQGLV